MIKVMGFVACFFLIACKEKEAKVTAVPLDATQQLVVNELNTLIEPINGADPSLGFDDLKPFDSFSNTKIVGMGECTHGTKEFFQMRHRIFSYLVQKHQFKAIAFEMDFAEAMIFEDYVQGRNNENLESLMKSRMLVWPWKTAEVEALIAWMKAYNVGKSTANRIHFLGFDCQLPAYNADFLASRISAVDPDLGNYISSQLVNYKKISVVGDSTGFKAIQKNVTNVYNKVSEQKTNLISKGLSIGDYETCKRLARTIVQVYTVTGGYIGIGMKGFLYRELYMAENAIWIQKSLGLNEKICLWAHNGHIGVQDLGMGGYIADSLAEDYKKIGFGFTRGQFYSLNKQQQLTVFSYEVQPPATTFTFIFRNSKAPNFYLGLNQVSKSGQFYSWVSNPHDLLSIGGTFDGPPNFVYQRLTLNEMFDSFVYFDKTTNTEILN